MLCRLCQLITLVLLHTAQATARIFYQIVGKTILYLTNLYSLTRKICSDSARRPNVNVKPSYTSKRHCLLWQLITLVLWKRQTENIRKENQFVFLIFNCFWQYLRIPKGRFSLRWRFQVLIINFFYGLHIDFFYKNIWHYHFIDIDPMISFI